MADTDDLSVQWQLANPFGIEMDERTEAWNSGHVNDIIEFPDLAAIVVATETGGVWMLTEGADALTLSANWENPDVKCLALGPDGPRHLFAGCTVAYDSAQKRSYKSETGSAPVIMETDSAQLIPLLEWRPTTDALPLTAGRITRIVVISHLRRIVVTCAKVRTGDTGGIFWSVIPPTPFGTGQPPRPPFVWKQATVVGAPAAQGFWDLAVAATRDQPSRDNLEDKNSITLVAGGFGGGGLVIGQWNDADDLVFERASVAFDDGADATGLVFDSCGTSSVSSCELHPTVLYAACAWPDGRLNSVMRSKDGGRHWVLCAARIAGGTGPVDLIQPLAGDQGGSWNNCISAHPENPGIAALGWQFGPFLTFDAGATWKVVAGGRHLHPDLHALQFVKETTESIGNLLVGSDGGIAKINLDDLPGEQGPPVRSDYNRRLPALQCYSTLIRQFAGTIDACAVRPGLLAAGLQDNGNVSCSLRPSVQPWRPIDGGDGGWNAFAAPAGYLHNSMGAPVIATAPLSPAVQTATIPVTLPPPGNPGGLLAAVGEPVMAPSHRNAAKQLLAAVAAGNASNTVFGLYADDVVIPPYHWELIGTIPDTQTVSALGCFQGDQVFVGTSQGKMYRIDVATGGVVEQTIKLPKPSPSTKMTGGAFLRIVGFNATSLFATLLGASETRLDGTPAPGIPAVQGYVLRLDGDTWNTTAGAGLPNELLYGFVAIAAPNTRLPHALMAATDDAVYLSRDDGQTWKRAASGLPRRPHCGDLRFVTDSLGEMKIHLGTFGWSFWSATLS